MRGFETLLAASVATAGVTQIALMVARSSHQVDVAPLQQPVSDCCQYRTWPVESSFWTFPFPSGFHPTTPSLPNRVSSLGLSSRTPSDGNVPPADSIYFLADPGTGPGTAVSFPWVDLVDSGTPSDADSANQTGQDASIPEWVGAGTAATSRASAVKPAPTPGLFFAQPEPGADTAPSPFVADIPPPSPTPDVTLPDPGDLPTGQVVGDLGGPGGDPPGGTTTTSDVPEPAALILVLTSLLGLGAARRPQRA